jgi:hypothetical protein
MSGPNLRVCSGVALLAAKSAEQRQRVHRIRQMQPPFVRPIRASSHSDGAHSGVPRKMARVSADAIVGSARRHGHTGMLDVMSELATAARPAGIIAKTSRRVAVALTMSIAVGLLMLAGWGSAPSSLFLRTIILGLSATAAFAVFEVWPRRLPRWLQRWVLQVVAVGVFMPVTTLLIYVLFTPQGAPPFWEVPGRMDGWTHLTFMGLLLAPWTALAAIVRQKEAFARDQKLAFALERSELERQALDARLHLLQAQVAPHFLLNTLANAGRDDCRRSLRRLTVSARAALAATERAACEAAEWRRQA